MRSSRFKGTAKSLLVVRSSCTIKDTWNVKIIEIKANVISEGNIWVNGPETNLPLHRIQVLPFQVEGLGF